jgi:hypothetical protein
MAGEGRAWAHGLVIVLGVALMIGGIVTGKAGAGIVGLLITAFNVEPWQKAMRARRGDPPGPPKSA